MVVTVRLESALDLVKKTERAKERHWTEAHDESSLKKFPKPSKQVLYQFIFHQICCPKPCLLNVGSRKDDKRYF